MALAQQRPEEDSPNVMKSAMSSAMTKLVIGNLPCCGSCVHPVHLCPFTDCSPQQSNVLLLTMLYKGQTSIYHTHNQWTPYLDCQPYFDKKRAAVQATSIRAASQAVLPRISPRPLGSPIILPEDEAPDTTDLIATADARPIMMESKIPSIARNSPISRYGVVERSTCTCRIPLSAYGGSWKCVQHR